MSPGPRAGIGPGADRKRTAFLVALAVRLIGETAAIWIGGLSLGLGIVQALGGLPVDFIALLFVAGGIASVLAGPRAGALSDRVGRKPLVLISSLGLTVLVALIPFVLAERWMVVAVYVLLMALFAMRMAPLQALLTALVPATERGAFLSLTIAVGQVGTALGATLGGALYGRWGFTADALASAATMALLAALVWTRFPDAAETDAESAPA